MTLDDDVAALLKRALARRKVGLKTVINDALRVGLRRLSAPPERPARHRTPSVDLGRCLVPSIDNIDAVLAHAEGDWHR